MIKGEIINGYTILEDFKVAGGMSKVSFARKNGKDYFIKEFLYPKYPTPESPGSEAVKMKKKKACEDFEKHHREINKKIGSKVSIGGNLVFAVDFFRCGASYYKINEKIDASTVACSNISELPEETILIIAKSVCHSVRILHNLSIVHGDLKPDNILIKKTAAGYSGKLIDFDDSYFSGNPPEDRECVVGTPEYYSPEQADYIMDEDEEVSGKTLTCKSDIFTLGIILSEYFTGEKPITIKGPVWAAIKRGESVRFAKCLNEKMKSLILSMISLNPIDRPTIDQVFEALRLLHTEPPTFAGFKTPAIGLRGGILKGEVASTPTEDTPPIAETPKAIGLRGKGLDIAKKK